MTAQRVQRRRASGRTMPDGTVYVGRPTKWGNPFRYLDQSSGLVRFGPRHVEEFGRAWDYEGRVSAHGASHDLWFSPERIVKTHVRWATYADLVELYRLALTAPTPGMIAAYPSRGGRFVDVTLDEVRQELAGRDLACWCPLDRPCHADVLLELANAPALAGAQ